MLLGCAHAGIVEILNDSCRSEAATKNFMPHRRHPPESAPEEYVKKAIDTLRAYGVKRPWCRTAPASPGPPVSPRNSPIPSPRHQPAPSSNLGTGAVMVIAIASGKGGTGKTTVASVATLASSRGGALPSSTAMSRNRTPTCFSGRLLTELPRSTSCLGGRGKMRRRRKDL